MEARMASSGPSSSASVTILSRIKSKLNPIIAGFVAAVEDGIGTMSAYTVTVIGSLSRLSHVVAARLKACSACGLALRLAPGLRTISMANADDAQVNASATPIALQYLIDTSSANP